MTWTLKRKILLERGKASASGSGWDVPQEPSPLPRGTQGGRRRFPPGTTGNCKLLVVIVKRKSETATSDNSSKVLLLIFLSPRISS